MKITVRIFASGLFYLASACIGASAQSTGSAAAGAAADWVNHNGDTDETAFSQLAQIDQANVAQLGLAWSLNLPGQTSLEATPVAVSGVLYFTGTYGKVYAVDGIKGSIIWTYDPEIWRHNPKKMRHSFAVNRGVAYADGKIFFASLDGRLFALNAKTGQPIWVTQTVALDNNDYVTGAPRVFDGKVLIGEGGSDLGGRGFLTAYDAQTGKQLWRFYTVPGSPAQNKGDAAMEMAASTWSPDFWKSFGGGGGPWDAITCDSELNQIYIGTANADPDDPEIRSPGLGTNLFTASIVALDANTGKYLWHYQVVPRDAWDYDATQQITLADLMIGGKPRKVLMQAPKDGFFYVIDRRSGKLLSAEPFTKVTWAYRVDLKTGRPVEEPHVRYDPSGVGVVWPAPMGAHSWMSMSYSPRTGLTYIPVMQLGLSMAKGVPQPGGFQVGPVNVLGLSRYPGDDAGSLVAWDPVAQKPAWKVPYDSIWNGGVLSTAGDLVFQGTAEGQFAAYNAKTGEKLWQVQAGGGVIAAPMSYEAGGKQYVALLVGYGGSTAPWGKFMNVGWKFGQPRYLLVFALGAKAALPPTPARDMGLHALDDPNFKIIPAQVAAGNQVFMNCVACHGVNLIGTGSPAPDLRESDIALYPKALYAVVHDGALLRQGMPQFSDLTQTQIDDLYAYIRAGARQALAQAKN